MKVIESNCETGEVTERDMTPEEIAAIQTQEAPQSEPSDEPTQN